MDFVMGLPLTASRKNVIWETVDRLIKSAHFLAIHVIWEIVDRLIKSAHSLAICNSWKVDRLA